jgi:poly(hydroxyalkanoate) depolymerase family esterase
MMKRIFALSIAFVFAITCLNAQTGWNAVTSFGTNPGNLNMYDYVPTGITGKAPLVVALHGCLENATIFSAQSGWNTLADNHKFYVVYPKQNAANNPDTCFNWFVPGDIERNQGEAYSIKQMVDYMKAHYNVDSTRVFVTGLSAGACMTSVMLACYPDVFSAGAVMAGAPYKAAENATDALYAMEGYITNTPAAWGDSVKSAYPTYAGTYPRVAVYQGSSDQVVNPINGTQVMYQWTNVLGASQTPATTITSFNGDGLVTKEIYNNASGNEVVETYTIAGMNHGIAVDTGTCYQKGGQAGTYAWEIPGLFSSFWAAYFFNILNNNTININGLTTVTVSQTGVTYSVTSSASTSYTWSVPAGASITGGQGTNQITVSFGSTSGNVSVTETNSVSCLVGPLSLFVTVGSTTGINQLSVNSNQFTVYPNPTDGIIHIQSTGVLQTVKVFNFLGEIVQQSIINSSESSIDLSSYPAGIYTLSIQEDGKAPSIRKVILR